MTKRVEWSLLLLILLAAIALRLWRLSDVPPGFTHDEAGHGRDAIAILHGHRPMYQTVGYGREPLFDYLLAGLMGLLGPTGRTLRLAPVFLSVATLLLTYVWARRAFDAPTALAAITFQAVSFWSLSTARQALRSGLLPALFVAAAYACWRLIDGTHDGSRRRFAALLAILIGATLYTYIPARATWTLFPLFLLYLALFHRATFRRTWRPALVAVGVGLLLALPLFAYLRAHPDAEQRLDMLDAPLQALSRGDLSVVLDRARSALTGFMLPGAGDDFLAYNIPGRPFLDPATGTLFLIGLALCLTRWRKQACAFALLWFLVSISPSLITGATASSTRSITAQPVTFLFPAFAVVAGAKWATGQWGRRAIWGSGLAFVGLIAITGALNGRDYFVTWGQSPHVRAAYLRTLTAQADYAESQSTTGILAVSTLYPNAPHDPFVWEISLDRRDANLLPFASTTRPLAAPTMRWFDARWALVIPPEPTARLLAPSSASLNSYFAELGGFQPIDRVSLRPDDLDPFFVAYDWDPQITLAALQSRSTTMTHNVGGVLQFAGYDLSAVPFTPGDTVQLVTLWRVVQKPETGDSDLVIFTHALDGLDAGGQIVGQQDRLDAPAWSWQTGDLVAQMHRFNLRDDLSPGPLTLQVGVYRRADGTRLPILTDGAAVDDRIILQTVEVIAP